jgi:hypothetical protein
MHFNEMCVKSRQLGLTFVTAALALAVVLLSQKEDFAFTAKLGGLSLTFHVAVLIILAAILGIQSVKSLDVRVYHRMLRGAVTFGEDLEKAHMSKILGLSKGMTQAISHFSRFDDASVNAEGKTYTYCGSTKITAEEKIKKFYFMVTLFLSIAAGAIFIFTNMPS